MNKTAKLLLLLSFAFFTYNSFAQTGDVSKNDMLIVHGDNFIFGIKEPENWKSDIKDAARYGSNIIFYKSKSYIDNGDALIQVYSFIKQDEQTEEDLKFDIKSYEEKYMDLKLEELTVSHKEYRCFSKMMFVKDSFYQYTVYVNPGIKFKSGISVAMNISNRPATEDELNAFRSIIASLVMLGE